MYIDKRLEFADGHAITASGAGQNEVDLGSDRDVGVGRMLYWVLQLDVASDGTTGDETYSVALQTDDNSSFSSATDIATLTVPRGSAAGTRFVVGFPWSNERYLRVYSTLGGTTPSMTYSSWITDQEPAKWTAYPDGLA